MHESKAHTTDSLPLRSTYSQQHHGQRLPPPSFGVTDSSSVATTIQANIAELEEELRTQRSTVEQLKAIIAQRNTEYIQHEEALCDRIGHLNHAAVVAEKKGPTEDEQRRIAERVRAAAQLQLDIQAAEQRLSQQKSEEQLSEVALNRLQKHCADSGSAASSLTSLLEPVVRSVRHVLPSPNEELQPAAEVLDGIVTSLKGRFSLPETPQNTSIDSDCSCVLLARARLEELALLLRECGDRMMERCATTSCKEQEAHKQFLDLCSQTERDVGLLHETNTAVQSLHAEVADMRRAQAQREEHLKALQAQMESATSSDGPHGGKLAGATRAVDALLESLSVLKLEAAQVAEKAALQRTEAQLAADMDNEQQLALDEAAALLEQRRSAQHNAEKEKSEAARRAFQVDERVSSLQQQLQRLTSELTASDEELAVTQQKALEAQREAETLQQGARRSTRELDTKKVVLDAALQRRRMAEHELVQRERELHQARSERSQIRRDLLAKQSELTAMDQRDREALLELVYVQRLLPKNHPSAKLPKSLADRAAAAVATVVASPETDAARLPTQGAPLGADKNTEVVYSDEVASIAHRKREELVESAKKSAAARRDAATAASSPFSTHADARSAKESNEGVLFPHHAREDTSTRFPDVEDHSQTTRMQRYVSRAQAPDDKAQGSIIEERHNAATASGTGRHSPGFWPDNHGFPVSLADAQGWASRSVSGGSNSPPPQQTFDDPYASSNGAGSAKPSPHTSSIALPPFLRPPADAQRPLATASQSAAQPRSASGASTSTHTSSIADINDKLNAILNRRRRE